MGVLCVFWWMSVPVSAFYLGYPCLHGVSASVHLLFLRMPKEGIGEVMEKEDCIQALSGQIFMGMVSSQYQARSDVVRLIEGLVNACIRFVYFSLEDELKSKVSQW